MSPVVENARHRLRSRRAFVHLLLALLVSWLPGLSATAEETGLPNWIPSLGIGVGVQSREINGSQVGVLFDGTPSAGRTVPCGLPNGLPFGVCDYTDHSNRALDGAVLDLSGQLFGPALESVFLKPRPFVFGRWDLSFDSRTITEAGANPEDFQTNLQDPDIFVRMRGNPETFWYAGGGVALQIPNDWTFLFLKLGAHYMEDRVEAIATVSRTVGSDPVQTNEQQDGLITVGIGPSVGLEAEVARFGPVALDFVADALFSFPISGATAELSIEEPTFPGDTVPQCSASPGTPGCIEPVKFKYDADNVHYFGVVALRFSWIGF